jgi:hypothetical protein
VALAAPRGAHHTPAEEERLDVEGRVSSLSAAVNADEMSDHWKRRRE